MRVVVSGSTTRHWSQSGLVEGCCFCKNFESLSLIRKWEQRQNSNFPNKCGLPQVNCTQKKNCTFFFKKKQQKLHQTGGWWAGGLRNPPNWKRNTVIAFVGKFQKQEIVWNGFDKWWRHILKQWIQFSLLHFFAFFSFWFFDFFYTS